MISKDPIRTHQYMFLRQANRYCRIDFDRILYLESRKQYCRIVTLDKVWIIKERLNQMEEVLPAADFCRVHRSFVVRLSHIEWFEISRLKIAAKEIPVGNIYRADLHRKVLLVAGETSAARMVVASDELVLS